jgi:hypothetical protein
MEQGSGGRQAGMGRGNRSTGMGQEAATRSIANATNSTNTIKPHAAKAS